MRWANIMYGIDVKFSCFIGDHSSAIRSGFLSPPELAESKRVGLALAAAPQVYVALSKCNCPLTYCFREGCQVRTVLPCWH